MGVVHADYRLADASAIVAAVEIPALVRLEHGVRASLRILKSFLLSGFTEARIHELESRADQQYA